MSSADLHRMPGSGEYGVGAEATIDLRRDETYSTVPHCRSFFVLFTFRIFLHTCYTQIFLDQRMEHNA